MSEVKRRQQFSHKKLNLSAWKNSERKCDKNKGSCAAWSILTNPSNEILSEKQLFFFFFFKYLIFFLIVSDFKCKDCIRSDKTWWGWFLLLGYTIFVTTVITAFGVSNIFRNKYYKTKDGWHLLMERNDKQISLNMHLWQSEKSLCFLFTKELEV